VETDQQAAEAAVGRLLIVIEEKNAKKVAYA
jgi:hypothetical protein